MENERNCAERAILPLAGLTWPNRLMNGFIACVCPRGDNDGVNTQLTKRPRTATHLTEALVVKRIVGRAERQQRAGGQQPPGIMARDAIIAEKRKVGAWVWNRWLGHRYTRTTGLCTGRDCQMVTRKHGQVSRTGILYTCCLLYLSNFAQSMPAKDGGVSPHFCPRTERPTDCMHHLSVRHSARFVAIDHCSTSRCFPCRQGCRIE